MSGADTRASAENSISLHQLGVVCGLAAGAWLGAAEAPTKLVTMGVSPFVITLGMVGGVFVARWTIPMTLKGSGFLFRDLRQNAHLLVWALMAGMLWVVANTLTVFAIRDVGLSIAFPLWNSNSLVGLFWGWLFFHELRGASTGSWVKVMGGATAIAVGAAMLAYATTQRSGIHSGRALLGVLAALGAGALWGTQYIPYRKAYISGISPLSFVTIIACGELLATVALGAAFHGGMGALFQQLAMARPVLFWLFLGGFCWVFGDLFQQYAAKYIGIGRGIPLSNTNQLWGLAWGALVFGEFAGLSTAGRGWVIAGSLLMIAGAAAIAMASAGASELRSWKAAMERECCRYGLDAQRLQRALRGEDALDQAPPQRRWWEALAPLAVVCLLSVLASVAHRPRMAFDSGWMLILMAATGLFLIVGATFLWKRTRFC